MHYQNALFSRAASLVVSTYKYWNYRFWFRFQKVLSIKKTRGDCSFLRKTCQLWIVSFLLFGSQVRLDHFLQQFASLQIFKGSDQMLLKLGELSPYNKSIYSSSHQSKSNKIRPNFEIPGKKLNLKQ